MTLFRPDDGKKFTWIFNWAHLGVGVVAQVLAGKAKDKLI